MRSANDESLPFFQFLIPWILSGGFIPPIMTIAGLSYFKFSLSHHSLMLLSSSLSGMTIAFTLLGSIALVYGGKACRRWTKDSFVHKM